MKNKLFNKSTLSFLCIFFYLSSAAQIKLVKKDCYTTYKVQGDTYCNARNYDLAIQQYQSAKYCNPLSEAQRKTLDSLIADVNKKRQATQKVVRKY